MKKEISTFKIRIDSVKDFSIGFELLAGEGFDDVHVNIVGQGGYGVSNRLFLTPKQFRDLAYRLLAYTYTSKWVIFDDNQKIILYDMDITIFDHENPQIGSPFFNEKNKERYAILSAQKKQILENIKKERQL